MATWNSCGLCEQYLESNMRKIYSSEKDLIVILTFIIISLLILIYLDYKSYDDQTRNLENKINQQQIDIEELFFRSDELFKRNSP